MTNCCLLSRLRRCARPAGPSDPGVQAGSRRDFPGSLKGARNIVRRERADDTNAQDNCHRKVEPIRRPVHSRPPPFGARFLQRNIEKLSKDRAALGQEIRESVAELSTRLWSLARRSRSRVRQTSTPRGQPSYGMRTVAQPGRGTPQQSTTTAQAVAGRPRSPSTFPVAIANSLVRNGAPDRLFLAQSPLGHKSISPDLRVRSMPEPTLRQFRRSQAWGSTPSRTCSLTPYRLDQQAGLLQIDESKAAGPPCHSQRRCRSPP